MSYNSWSSRSSVKNSSRNRPRQSSQLKQINFNGVVSPYARGNAWPKSRSPLRDKNDSRRRPQNSMVIRGEAQGPRQSMFETRSRKRDKSRQRTKSTALTFNHARSPELLISPVSLPNSDSIYFVSDPQYPGVPILYRRKDHSVNQERLNLDRRNLTQCPMLRNEQRLRLLNFENNSIRSISNLSNLPNLIFLDLYNNDIQIIEGLDQITTLRVLMLGRNRIRNIGGLDRLNRLDVLDLHGNEITSIHNLNHLINLRVLNLADNQIEIIENLEGLNALVEFNCRRNQITDVTGLQALSGLERLFLSDNRISDLTDLSHLKGNTKLKELSLDGNPISDEENYRIMSIKSLSSLLHLDLKKISGEERSLAQAFASVPFSQVPESPKRFSGRCLSQSPSRPVLAPLPSSPMSKQQTQQMNWLQEIQSSRDPDVGGHSFAPRALVPASSDFEQPSALSHHTPLQTEEEVLQHIEAQWAKENESFSSDKGDNLRMQHIAPQPVPHYFYNKDGKNIKISGHWNPPDTSLRELREINFSYIEYNTISTHFALVKKSCPNLRTVKFSFNNIHCLYQIDQLALISQVQNLIFGKDATENPILDCPIYRLYTIFRFPNLKTLDGKVVEGRERGRAKRMFSRLKGMWKNPNVLRTKGWCSPNMNRPKNSKNKKEFIDNLYKPKKTSSPPDKIVVPLIAETLRELEISRIIRDVWPKVLANFVEEAMQEFEQH